MPSSLFNKPALKSTILGFVSPSPSFLYPHPASPPSPPASSPSPVSRRTTHHTIAQASPVVEHQSPISLLPCLRAVAGAPPTTRSSFPPPARSPEDLVYSSLFPPIPTDSSLTAGWPPAPACSTESAVVSPAWYRKQPWEILRFS